MKKKISVLLSCMMAASSILSGCGASKEPAVSSSNTPAAQENASDTTVKKNSEEVTLTLLSWNNEQLMGAIIKDFEAANSGIKIDLQFVPPVQQYVDKFMVLAASNQMTDMFYTCAENKDEIISKGLAEDLSSMEIFKRIPANTSATYGNEGKIYAFSPDAWVGGIFYNKELFEKAGITEAPKTWADFIKALEKTKALGIEPLVSGSEQVHEIAQDLYCSEVIAKDPQTDLKINKGETTFSKEYTDSFARWYNDIYKTGLFSQVSLGLNADQAVDMFVTGQAAMYHGGPWNIATFVEKNPNLKFDIFPVPAEDGKTILTGALSPGLSISTSSKHKEACQKFLDFVSHDEQITKWQKLTGNVLVVDGINYEMDSVINQFKDKAVAGEFYLPQIVWKNSAAIYKEMLIGVQDAMTGGDTIENIPVRMDKKMEELSASN